MDTVSGSTVIVSAELRAPGTQNAAPLEARVRKMEEARWRRLRRQRRLCTRQVDGGVDVIR